MKHIKQLIKDKLGSTIQEPRDIEAHLKSAAEWLLVAQNATPDDGVAHSYDIKTKLWNASYPETTGYAIPTLYDYARLYHAPAYAEAARRMTHWESDIQLEDGGVRAGTMSAEIVAPTIFNTGQVLFGWAKAYVETKEERFRASLVRASDWLVEAQDDDGAWRRFPSPFTTSKLNSYNTRSAFGLVRAYEATGIERYLAAAVKNADWVLSRAHANGWLPDNCLLQMPDNSALTHTLAYSIRGLLEIGAASGRQDLLEHALLMARRLAKRQREDGALPGRYLPLWTTVADWTCVTGNSQMAINWLRLAQLTGEHDLKQHAVRANRFNMSIQDLETEDCNVRGALKGSHPVNGEYMTYKYPNWATKFFMDGLMLEQHFDKVNNIG
ncbi:pectate lyase [Massilia niastensis]|uniref:pectate lyase n=1 Tax=Massilia niastensis TaxID=544911 RepID=UPI00036F85AC|nr:pectate lyase [Massilia niastensis]